MSVKNKIDISKYSISLMYSTTHDIKGPCTFIGHKVLDIGQIWIMSATEKKWIIYEEGSLEFIESYWDDIKDNLRTDSEVIKTFTDQHDVNAIKDLRILKGHIKIQENCWILI